MVSLRASRPGSGYYKALNSLSTADFYEFQTDHESQHVTSTSYLQLPDPSSLPQDVYTVDRLLSTRNVKVCYS